MRPNLLTGFFRFEMNSLLSLLIMFCVLTPAGLILASFLNSNLGEERLQSVIIWYSIKRVVVLLLS